ncbi:MAG: hypothetical protein CFE43_08695 [Burkholderiales bacterium PBB3]|nr:MAG: hypothetical protein CFE43_08695 [Burkholderiales bacterium PBB3]
MHGSRSVPQEWLVTIRQFGGHIKETYGRPMEEIQCGIYDGVRNININTDVRLTMTGAMRQVFAQQPSEIHPRKALVAVKNVARGIVNARRSDAGRGPRSGQDLAEDERQALRQHHAQDQDRVCTHLA